MPLHAASALPLAGLVAIAMGCGGNVVVDGASSRGTSGAGASSGAHGTSSMANGAGGAGAGGATSGPASGGATSAVGAGGTSSGSSEGGSSAFSSSSAGPASSSSSGAGGGTTDALWEILGLPSTTQHPGVSAPLMAVDSSGDTFFAAATSVGPVTFASQPSCAGAGVLLAEVSPAGQLLWLECIIVGPNDDQGAGLVLSGVALSDDGRAAVTGSFHGTLAYQGTSYSTTPGTGDVNDMFLLDLDASSGAVQWSKHFITTQSSSSYGWGLAGDASGDLYLGGYLYTTLDVGAGSLTPPPMTVSLFVAKFDQSGAGEWITEVGHAGFESATPVTVVASRDGSRAALMTSFQGTADFGSETQINSTAPLLVELDAPTGTIAWGVRSDDPHTSGAFTSIAFDGDLDLFIAGDIHDLDLGAGQLSPNGLPFLAKLDPTGAVVWQKAFSATEQQNQNVFRLGVDSLAADASGDALVLFDTNAATVTVDATSFACPITGNFIGCYFVGRVDAAGDVTFGDVMSGSRLASGAVAFGAGHPLVGGAFSRWVDFGAGPVPSPATGDAVFLAELP